MRRSPACHRSGPPRSRRCNVTAALRIPARNRQRRRKSSRSLRRGKPRRSRFKMATTPDWKRAIVVLDENSRIELF